MLFPHTLCVYTDDKPPQLIQLGPLSLSDACFEHIRDLLTRLGCITVYIKGEQEACLDVARIAHPPCDNMALLIEDHELPEFVRAVVYHIQES